MLVSFLGYIANKCFTIDLPADPENISTAYVNIVNHTYQRFLTTGRTDKELKLLSQEIENFSISTMKASEFYQLLKTEMEN